MNTNYTISGVCYWGPHTVAPPSHRACDIIEQSIHVSGVQGLSPAVVVPDTGFQTAHHTDSMGASTAREKGFAGPVRYREAQTFYEISCEYCAIRDKVLRNCTKNKKLKKALTKTFVSFATIKNSSFEQNPYLWIQPNCTLSI
jgi:hypothetical protein